jgi:hypothetical protein
MIVLRVDKGMPDEHSAAVPEDFDGNRAARHALIFINDNFPLWIKHLACLHGGCSQV